MTLIAPVWSPTGDRMACWNPRGNSVLLFDPNVPWGEQEPEEVLRDDSPENFFPWSWSPDGEWLAGDLVQESGAFEGITIYSTTSRAIETITDFGSGPAFLSDSRRLLFTDTEGRLYLVDRETKTPVLIPGAPALDLVQVGPHDLTLFYTHRTEEADIWLLSAPGTY